MITSATRVHILVALLASAVGALPALAQKPADPTAVEHWRSLRFGMFVHWGPVALTGKEIGWSRGNPTPVAEYDALYRRFDPQLFDADAWVTTAKAAGMKYVVLTTKHHDGFCLWPSKHTEYDIEGSPFDRDPVAELAAACRRQGLEFGTYYSVPDWYHPDYPKGSPAGRTDKPNPNPERYAKFLRDQVTELVTRYGPLLTMWFDMPREFGPEFGVPTIDLLRELQPNIVINNRAYTAGGRVSGITHQLDVGDYDTPEQRIGGFQRNRPWETCMTICRQWAWKPDDRLKSLAECVRTLVYTIGGDGNLLLNVGPMPDGRIEPSQVDRLRELGVWVERHADAVYDTRGGPYVPGKWGASTCKGDRVYLFVFGWPDEGPLVLPALGAEVKAVRLLSGSFVDVEATDEHLALYASASARRTIPTVIELRIEGPAFDIEPHTVPVRPSGSLAFGAAATASNTFRKQAEYAPGKAFDDDPDTRWATDTGTSEAWLEVDLGSSVTVGRIAIDEPEQYARIRKFELQQHDGEAWHTIHAGTTVGPGWSTDFQPETTRKIRLRILNATEGPTLSEFHVFPPRSQKR